MKLNKTDIEVVIYYQTHTSEQHNTFVDGSLTDNEIIEYIRTTFDHLRYKTLQILRPEETTVILTSF